MLSTVWTIKQAQSPKVGYSFLLSVNIESQA